MSMDEQKRSSTNAKTRHSHHCRKVETDQQFRAAGNRYDFFQATFLPAADCGRRSVPANKDDISATVQAANERRQPAQDVEYLQAGRLAQLPLLRF